MRLQRRFSLALVLLGLVCGAAQAQQGAINGHVTDATTGETLPGVNLRLADTSLGAATDLDGAYNIANIPAGTYTLVATFIGYKTYRESVTVGASPLTVDIELREDLVGLDEVVVTGQGGGIENRRLSTTVTTISPKQLDRVSNLPLDAILQTSLPNATVRFSSGLPGTSSIIRARGIVSANANTTPVIYIDGVRVDNNNGRSALEISTGGNESSSIADIPVENIERIEFIPGGAATTLYGSDAANGVLQIFTKPGVQGRSSFTFETTQGVSVANQDFLRFKATGDLLYRAGHTQTYRLGATGGNAGYTYSFSGSMSNDDGFRYELGDTRYNLRTTLSAAVSDDLRYTGTLGFSSNRFDRVLNANLGGLYADTDYGYQQSTGLYDLERGSPAYDAILDSLRLQDALYGFTEDVKRFQTSHGLDFSPIQGLALKGIVGLDYRVNNQDELYWTEYLRQTGSNIAPSQGNLGDLTRSDRKFLGITLESSAQYQRTFGDVSSVSTLGGQIFRDEDRQSRWVANDIADGSRDGDTGSNPTIDDFTRQVANYGAFVAQNFGYKNRYFLELGLRGDGNSAFGEEVGVQWYPKVGVSYVLSDEPFFEAIPSVAIAQMKLRANYGVAGNFPQPFVNERTLTPAPFIDGTSLRFGQPGDATLKPEKTTTWEVGTDLALLDGRVNVTFTYYDAQTQDALFAAPFNPSSGQDNQLRNLGEISNKGYELGTTFLLTSRRNLDLRLSAALNHVENKVLSTGGAPEFNLYGFTFLGRYVKEGLPVGYLRGTRVHLDRVDANGDLIQGAFEDGGAFESNAFLGNATPSHWGALTLTANVWNRLDFLITGDFQWGGDMINLGERYRMFNDVGLYDATGEDPNIADWADREWKQFFLDGQIASGQMGDVLVTSSDFFKVRLISMSYTIPEKYLFRGLKGLQIGAAVQNPFVFTSAPIDPELSGLNTGAQGALNVGGYAYGADSLPRTYTLSVKTRL